LHVYSSNLRACGTLARPSAPPDCSPSSLSIHYGIVDLRENIHFRSIALQSSQLVRGYFFSSLVDPHDRSCSTLSEVWIAFSACRYSLAFPSYWPPLAPSGNGRTGFWSIDVPAPFGGGQESPSIFRNARGILSPLIRTIQTPRSQYNMASSTIPPHLVVALAEIGVSHCLPRTKVLTQQ